MGSKRLKVVPVEVRGLSKKFERWRASKQGRERIPAKLWDAAVKLCEKHRVHRVARWLRLNHTVLRDRAKDPVGRGSRRFPRFVELAPPALPPATAALAEYLLEVERAGERTLRVRVRGVGVAEVAALAGALRGDGQPG